MSTMPEPLTGEELPLTGKSATDGAERPDAGTSRSVERALRLAHTLATAEQGITLSAAARDVQLPTSTTARLLKTLEACGYAWRDAAGQYHPGSSLFQVGALALGRLPIYKLAEIHLRELADLSGETAYLAVPNGRDQALYLRQVESPRAIRHASWAGRAIPTPGTAVGAALAGRVNGAGFAESRATAIEPDAAAVAAPVLDSTGDVVAALSIIGPSFRITDEDLQRFGAAVGMHARALSTELGSTTIG
jgi:IclR family transcriptional regulator, acetate operon repressor